MSAIKEPRGAGSGVDGGEGAKGPRGAEDGDAAGTVVGGRAGDTSESTDAVIAQITNVQGTSGVYSDTNGVVKKRGGAVAIQERGSGATRNRTHYTQGGDHANTMVVLFRNKEIAIGCKGQVLWAIKCSGGACAVCPCAAPSARKGGHCAIGKDEPDTVVVIVPHIDIPTAIDCYTIRIRKSRSASPHTIGKGRVAPSAS